ncbi:MAG TPA: DUF4406 domain-containing protein [Pyrinomonadaceae bacterium]|nr:DUF4406 domain-containing protein [Pyrinomonadaceae bacterium]
MKKIYISGKITGLDPVEARAKFDAAERGLRAFGYEPVNPMALVEDRGQSWAEFMAEDIKLLAQCDGIWLLSDWRESRGARIEFQIAAELGLQIIQPSRGLRD